MMREKSKDRKRLIAITQKCNLTKRIIKKTLTKRAAHMARFVRAKHIYHVSRK